MKRLPAHPSEARGDWGRMRQYRNKSAAPDDFAMPRRRSPLTPRRPESQARSLDPTHGHGRFRARRQGLRERQPRRLRLQPAHRRRRADGGRRAVGVRKVDVAPAPRRARDREPRHAPHRSAGGERSAPRRNATSRWCSRITRCIRTARSRETSSSRCACEGSPRDEIRRRVDWAANLLGLSEEARSTAEAALGRRAPASGHGAGARPRARPSSCSTSRSRTSTPSFAARCARRSPRYSNAPRRR